MEYSFHVCDKVRNRNTYDYRLGYTCRPNRNVSQTIEDIRMVLQKLRVWVFVEFSYLILVNSLYCYTFTIYWALVYISEMGWNQEK